MTMPDISDIITDEMLPVIAKEKLADYIDVFCEKGFFSPEETETILRAGLQYGLKPKLHVNQLNSIGGIETGIKINALSMDHLENLPDEDIIRIKNSGWKGFCTLLPTAAFFLRIPFRLPDNCLNPALPLHWLLIIIPDLHLPEI